MTVSSPVSNLLVCCRFLAQSKGYPELAEQLNDPTANLSSVRKIATDCGLKTVTGHCDLRNSTSARLPDFPVVVELTTGKFLVALQQSATSLTLCDPSSLIDGAPRKETVALANFLAVFSGGILSFQKINTILACFVICARERGIEVTAERLTHEYGLTENEIKPQPFLRMAKESGLKTGMKEKLNWAYFSHLGRAWPVIAPMKNGKHILLAGFSDDHLLAYDPLAEEGVIRLNKEQFVPRWSGTLYLLKRRARLADEDQPFSLRWFIPEILRQKTVFFDIALAVLFIHAIALITPLFFQIVIDKVLVNQALTTLHTLVFSSVRSYSDS